MSSLIVHFLLPMFFIIATGKYWIKLLKGFQSCGQPIRELGPASHLVNKKGTPTMGGLMIICTIIFFTIAMLDLSVVHNQVMLFALISHAILGGLDDLAKILKKNSAGIRAKGKIVIQIAIAGITVYLLSRSHSLYSTVVDIPIIGNKVDFGPIFYPIFATLVIVATSNSVNLTDGLDGLVTIPTVIAIMALCYLQGEFYPLSIITIGSCLGFLWHNSFPAKVFMGDLGSLALGGLLGAMVLITKQELLFIVIGAIFVVESLSVILQVGYFKLSHGKRIFPMAPIHHSFEKLGMHEVTIVTRFWLASLVFALIGIVLSGEII